VTDARSWEMSTYRRTTSSGEVYYMYFGDEAWVRRIGFGDPVVKVRLSEDAQGDYFAWTEAARPDDLRIVALDRLFRVQFPYGTKVMEEAGQGKVVQLRVEEIA
jgi:hypothetical protein